MLLGPLKTAAHMQFMGPKDLALANSQKRIQDGTRRPEALEQYPKMRGKKLS